jgi:Fungal fruit body lectin
MRVSTGSQPVVQERSACLSTATRVALSANHKDMNKFSDREGPYDDVKYSLQRIYESVVDAESPMEDEGHYIFAVKTTAPEFDLVDFYPSDLWMIKKEVMRLSMGGSGTSGCIMFQKKTSRERFAVTLGVHNYAPWTAIATNFRDETPQEIKDSYYGGGKRNVSSVTNGSRLISKPLMAGRSVDLTFDQEVDKNRYPTEVIVK